MRIGYAVLVSDEVYNFMRQFEVEYLQRYGGNRGLTQPPHITIKGPFDTHDLAWHANYLDSLARKTRPFTIHLRGIGAFPPPVLFLNVEPHPELSALTETILADLPAHTHTPFEANRDLHPHATLAFPRSEVELQQALEEYAGRAVGFDCIVNSIGLLYQHEESWIILRKATLSGQGDGVDGRSDF